MGHGFNRFTCESSIRDILTELFGRCDVGQIGRISSVCNEKNSPSWTGFLVRDGLFMALLFYAHGIYRSIVAY